MAKRPSAPGAAWVFGILADGGYARHLVAPASALYPLPPSIEPNNAAALHCTFGTAYRDLVTLGKIKRSERVLVTGANGGVGRAAVQIAVRAGAHVIAVVRADKHAEPLAALECAQVVVSAKNDFHERVGDVDLALDTVGAPTFLSTLRALKIGGRAVVIGNVVAEKFGLNLGFVITRGLTIIGGSGDPRRDAGGPRDARRRSLHDRRRPRLPAPPRGRSAARRSAPVASRALCSRPRPELNAARATRYWRTRCD